MGRTAKAGKPAGTKTNSAVTKTSTMNKRVLKSIIVKAGAEVGETQDVDDKIWCGVNGVIEAPYPMLTLTSLWENSSELRQCVDAMVTNIDSFGHRLVEVDMEEGEAKKNAKAILTEKAAVSVFLKHINYDESLVKLRKETRKNIEDCGNAFWEFVPYKNKPGVSSINRIKPHTIKPINLDKKSIAVDLKYYNEFTKVIESRPMRKRFRRFVQIVGSSKNYFKEYGDPRTISRIDGKVIHGVEKIKDAKKKGEIANSIYHHKIGSDRTPWGIPRYIGNLFSIYGSRAADEINYVTFNNNNIPSMIVMVSNGQLTGESVERVQEFVDAKVKGSDNMSSFLIIEAEPADDLSLNPGTMKMEIKDLSNAQKEDQLFQEYDKNNSEKIRRCFRLPPIFVGKEESINRATAQESRKLADEQVFSPERDDFDVFMNKVLVSEFGMKYHTFKSNSANVTNDEDLVKVLSSGEKTGGVTPNLSRKILSDVLNTELPQYDPAKVPFDPDIPLSYSLVEMSKTVGGNADTGKIAPNQGQIPKNGDEAVAKATTIAVLEELNEILGGDIFTGEDNVQQ